jgi:glutamine synthetase
MPKYKLEYLWLDGYEPVPNIRGKTKIEEFAGFPKLEELPIWGFDGSSTRQAEGHSSDCMLKPVARFPDTTKQNGVLVMCEVLMPDKKTPHPSNSGRIFPMIPMPGSVLSRSISSTRTASP